MIKGMFVDLDRSPVAESVIPYVAELAAGLAAPVTLLTVIDRPRESGEPTGGSVPSHEVSSVVLTGDPQQKSSAMPSASPTG